jgi:hypothetical protein
MSDDDTFVTVAPWWWVTNTGGIALTGVLAARTGRRSLRRLFWAAVAIHVGEAAYSYARASRAGFRSSAPRWALQTLGVGFPSLISLDAAVRATSPATDPSGDPEQTVLEHSTTRAT